MEKKRNKSCNIYSLYFKGLVPMLGYYFMVILILLTVFVVSNLMFANVITNSVELKHALSLSEYTNVGVTNNGLARDDFYEFVDKDASFYSNYDENAEEYSGALNATILKEIEGVDYTNVSQINASMVCEGQYKLLSGNEIAVSEVIAKENDLQLGTVVYVNNNFVSEKYIVEYIYFDNYCVFDIDINNKTGSILLSCDSNIISEKGLFLHFMIGEGEYTYSNNYLKSTEISNVSMFYIIYIIISSLICVILSCVVLFIFHHNLHKRYNKLLTLGMRRRRLNTIIAIDLMLPILPALALALIILSLAFSLNLLQMLLVCIQVLVVIVINMAIVKYKGRLK